ncbi:hypothetical protein D3C86_1541570 [compost metagenome]
MVHAVFQAQGKAAVLLDRQVIPRPSEIQGAGFDPRLVAGFQHRQGHPSREDFGELAASCFRQVQHHHDRQAEAFAQRAEERKQRLHAACRGADHNSFYTRQFLCAVHDLR